jgi:RimJ/RimL family protein N-acetyltransferase
VRRSGSERHGVQRAPSEAPPTIRIRPYRRGDEALLHEAARESLPEVSLWLPWCHANYSMADAVEWVGTRPAAFDRGEQYDFVIAGDKERFLGGCGLNRIDAENRTANLGYWVRTSATRRGVASAAIRRLADFAFSSTDLVRLEILAAVGNLASRRAAEKAGALREGILHDRLIVLGRPSDAVVYAILRSRWGERAAAG